MPFAIGIQNSKFEVNIGTLMRSAYNFGASLVFTINRRYTRQCSDTPHAMRHIPTLHFSSLDECWKHLPYGWIPVGVELTEDAGNLMNFVHPKQAVYFLGPEDGNINRPLLDEVKYKIKIPSRSCLNVAVAGSIVMYDRMLKEHQKKGVYNVN